VEGSSTEQMPLLHLVGARRRRGYNEMVFRTLVHVPYVLPMHQDLWSPFARLCVQSRDLVQNFEALQLATTYTIVWRSFWWPVSPFTQIGAQRRGIRCLTHWASWLYGKCGSNRMLGFLGMVVWSWWAMVVWPWWAWWILSGSTVIFGVERS
jgi:hypothetical protein